MRSSHARAPPAAAMPLVLAVLLLAGCMGGPETPPVASFRDVHGLAVHPQDPDIIFVATHHGLFRGSEKGGFQRVGAGEDDLMGFTLHPKDASVAWSSGHPGGAAAATAASPNLGVRKSTDGGATWSALALPGVDFHAMAASPADPQRLWGFARGELHRSTDGGASWEVVSRGIPMLYGLAASPTEPERVYAATGQGVVESADGGRTWQPLGAAPARGLALAPNGTTVYAAAGGTIQRSDDAGRSWSVLGLRVASGDVAHVAVSPSRPETVWAVTYLGAVFRSDDGGANWREVKPAG